MRNDKRVTKEEIPGDYQFWALHEGKKLQQTWHFMRQELARLVLKDTPYNRVLDAGCGSGIILNAICSPGMDVAGVDIKEECLQFTKDYLKHLNPTLIRAEIDDTGCPPGSRDLIVCCEVMEHLSPDKVNRVLKHFHEVLAPGGHLMITVPNRRSLWVVIEWILDTLNLVPALKGEQHLCDYNCRSLKRILEETGFTISRLGTFNLLSPFLAALSRKLGRLMLAMEAGLLKRGGNLIYVLARKPGP